MDRALAKDLVTEAFYELKQSTSPEKPIKRSSGEVITQDEIDTLERNVLSLIDNYYRGNVRLVHHG